MVLIHLICLVLQQDDSFPRQRPGAGSRDKFSRGRGRGRYQRGRDERGLGQKEPDEEAKLQEAVSLNFVIMLTLIWTVFLLAI